MMKYKLSILLLLVSILNAEIKECFTVENKTEFIGCLESEVKKSDSVKDVNFLASIYVNDKEYEKAIKLYEKSVEKGNVKAMYYLGGIYNEALKDYDKALYWFEKAFINKYDDAVLKVARVLDDKYNKDQDAVREYLQKRIKNGDNKAYDYLGAYERRYDNYDRARKALKTAASLGSVYAMLSLGSMEGHFLKNKEEGLKWDKKAAALGSPMGTHNVGWYYQEKKECKKAIEWYEKSWKLGYWNSPYAIAECYRKMGEFDKAKEQYLKMVKEGNIKGYKEIGAMYSNSLQDKEEAVKWYKKGIDAGDSIAAASAGAVYRDREEYENALKYFQIAYEMGSPIGANEIAYYYLRTVKDEKKAIEWYKKANRLGDPRGLKFLKNIGVYDE